MRKLILLGFFCAAAATAGEGSVMLKEGPGRDKVAAHCSLCHSLDYIPMNGAILDRAGWEKTVAKMIEAMGAPIEEADRRAIVDYLASHYGK